MLWTKVGYPGTPEDDWRSKYMEMYEQSKHGWLDRCRMQDCRRKRGNSYRTIIQKTRRL